MNRLPLEPVSLLAAAADLGAFATALGRSFERYGFAVVANHGLPAAPIAATLTLFQEFFAWPDARKRAYHIPGGAGARGYTPFGVETAQGAAHQDLKEFWHVGRELPAGDRYRRYMPDNVWVDELTGFQATLDATYAAFDRLGARLLAAVALYLGLPADWFADKVNQGNSVLRILHYPPLATASPAVRAAAHEDINVITLLLGADEAGLEVRDRDGGWLALNPPAGMLVCNVGDMLARLTNGRLPSTTHRVANPTAARAHRSRYSMPFFVHFNPDYRIETLPDCLDPAHPERHPPPITADEFLQQRLAEIRLK